MRRTRCEDGIFTSHEYTGTIFDDSKPKKKTGDAVDKNWYALVVPETDHNADVSKRPRYSGRNRSL